MNTINNTLNNELLKAKSKKAELEKQLKAIDEELKNLETLSKDDQLEKAIQSAILNHPIFEEILTFNGIEFLEIENEYFKFDINLGDYYGLININKFLQNAEDTINESAIDAKNKIITRNLIKYWNDFIERYELVNNSDSEEYSNLISDLQTDNDKEYYSYKSFYKKSPSLVSIYLNFLNPNSKNLKNQNTFNVEVNFQLDSSCLNHKNKFNDIYYETKLSHTCKEHYCSNCEDYTSDEDKIEDYPDYKIKIFELLTIKLSDNPAQMDKDRQEELDKQMFSLLNILKNEKSKIENHFPIK